MRVTRHVPGRFKTRLKNDKFGQLTRSAKITENRYNMAAIGSNSHSSGNNFAQSCLPKSQVGVRFTMEQYHLGYSSPSGSGRPVPHTKPFDGITLSVGDIVDDQSDEQQWPLTTQPPSSKPGPLLRGRVVSVYQLPVQSNVQSSLSLTRGRLVHQLLTAISNQNSWILWLDCIRIGNHGNRI